MSYAAHLFVSRRHAEATTVSHGHSQPGHPGAHVGRLPRTASPFPSTYFLPVLSFSPPGAFPPARTVEMPTPQQPSHT